MLNNTNSFKSYISERFEYELLKPNIFYFPENNLAFLFQEIEDVNWNDPIYLKALQSEYRLKNIQLVIIWEDQWQTKQPIIKSRINAIFGKYTQIHGRKTKAIRINKATTDTFLFENHLQGSVTAKFKYGLYLKEELVGVATFSGGRKLNNKPENYRSYELIRFANKLNTRVYGGFDKLIQAFVLDQKPNDIMTYADCEWSDGGSYERLNFKLKNEIAPTPFFIHLETMERLSLKKYENNSQNKTDFIKIFNTGSLKFVKEI